MSQQKIHWNIDPIDRQGAIFNIITGKRSNGKSYQAKHKKGVDNYLFETDSYYDSYKDKGNVIRTIVETGKRFILMRRWKEEISTSLIEQYFSDVDVEKLTEGKYNCITCYKKKLYFSLYDHETGKTARFDHIGYVVALSTEQNYAGGSYLDVTDIIFEEFMSRSEYLGLREPDKLMNFYSTVDRGKGTTRLWLLGNKISKVCPYIEAWGLTDIFKNIKQGQILTKWVPTGEVDEDGIPIEVKIAVEDCANTGGSNFVIGTHSDMINKGEWQTDPQPHLPNSINDYKKIYRIGFQYQNFKFIADYIQDIKTKERCWFIYPYKDNFKSDLLVFSDIIKVSKYWQRDIYNPSIKNDRLRYILQTFRESCIFYSSDECGTDFKQVIDFEIRK